MKVKMKSLGEKVKHPKGMPTMPMKSEIRHPSLELHAGQVDGLDGLALGDKVNLSLDGEVDESRNPAEYEKEKKSPVIRFKLHRGAVTKKKDKKLDKDYDKQVDMGEQE